MNKQNQVGLHFFSSKRTSLNEVSSYKFQSIFYYLSINAKNKDFIRRYLSLPIKVEVENNNADYYLLFNNL